MLKIAGVKTEAAFYKKYPTQEAFMKVHGKEFKKAQMGTLVGGGSPTQFVPTPTSYVDFQEFYDNADKLNTGSTQTERDKADAAAAQAAAKGGDSGGGMMGGMGDIMKMFGGEGSGDAAGAEGLSELAMAARYGTDVPRAYSGFSTPNWFKNANPPGDYYNKFNTPGSTAYGQNLGIGAQTMGRLGEPQASKTEPPIDTTDPNWMRKKTNTPPYTGAPSPSSSDRRQGETPTKSGFTQAIDAIGPFAGPLGSIAGALDELKAEENIKKNAERDATVSGITRMASETREEESKRRYVRPEDIQNTGE